MKIIMLLAVFIVTVSTVSAQPPHICGVNFNFAVVYDRVDNQGYAPRSLLGSETVFNCIADFDPGFAQQRFPSSWQALNYWFTLVSQELGVVLQPLPAPSP